MGGRAGGTGDVPVLYIGGMGRSGSTVLAAELSRLDGAVSVGELRYLWDRGLTANHLCGCGVPFRDCDFWSAVLTQAYGEHVDEWQDTAHRVSSLDRIRNIPSLTYRALRNADFRAEHGRYADVMRRLYRAIHEVSGGRVVVDSSKDPSYAFALNSVPGIDLRLVHLIRDSRAVAYSWTRRKIRPEIHWQLEYMNTRPPMLSARRWVQYNLLFEMFGRWIGPALRMRYEDFAADPDRAVSAIVAMGADPLRDKAADQPFRHSISGNPVRFLDEPAPIRVDDAWRSEMSGANRLRVTAATAPLLRAYRYPLLSAA